MNSSLLNKFKAHKITVFLLLLSILQFSIYILLRENVCLPVVDTMDINIPQFNIVATSEYAFCSFNKTVPQILNGINRDLLTSDLNIIYWLFFFLKPFWAYTINLFFIKLVAFVGMFFFLKNNFSSFTQKQVAIGAFLFSCLPFYSFFGIGIAGQPLLINALINFHKKKENFLDYFVLFLFPFYSPLMLTNLFIIFSCGLFIVFFVLKNKKIPWRLLFSTTILLLLGLLVEYRLIHEMLNPHYVFHRVEFNFSSFVNQKGIRGLIVETIIILTKGITHVETFYFIFVLFILFLYASKIRKANYKKSLFAVITYIVLIGLLYGLRHSSFYDIFSSRIGFLKTFQIDRFYTLLPLLYFVVGAICVQSINENPDKLRKNLLTGIVMIASIVIFFSDFSIKSFKSNFRKSGSVPSYAEYYDSNLFEEVRGAIPFAPSEYRVVGVGVVPDVLQYNGFYTLDGYLNLYPLEYKKKFRKVIEKELAKSGSLKNYFDSWGNRCYLFSAEIEGQSDKRLRKNATITNLNINTQALKEITKTDIYLISVAAIQNNKEIGLEFIKEFNTSKSYRDIYLYKVI